jgi:hypothetical protein
MEKIELYQDNKSAELLMMNGWFSSGKQTKHIKAKFFIIKDKNDVDDGEIRVVHCPTKEMWADVVLTKPLQGQAFREMRATLMNCKVNYKEEEMAIKESMA